MDFTINRGDSVKFDMLVSAAGQFFNLTGCTIWFTAKNEFQDPDSSAVFQKTTSNGIVITNAAQGLCRVTLNPDDTSFLPNTKILLLWDAQIRTPQGEIYTIAGGNLTVIPDVTRAV